MTLITLPLTIDALVLREAIEQAQGTSKPEGWTPPMVGEGNWYEGAARAMEHVLLTAPTDAPTYLLDALRFNAALCTDLAESQAADFLGEDERVDLADVVPIDDTPYDEDVT
jgi:hypothetical protein